MRVVCAGYRDWSLRIYDELAKQTNHQFLIFRSREQYDEEAIRDFNPDLVLLYGWSWIIPAALVNDFKCLMLHPSPLPKYRGGSPIQNQIIAGETISAVTIFLMDQGIDSGPIVAQQPFSLDGQMKEVLDRLFEIGLKLTLKLLCDGLSPIKQNEEFATIFRRRKPEDSEITIEELLNYPASYLYNKIRMLQSPYPNAFVRTSDGKRLLITEAKVED
jgi:methionyl-tRNA formyltransferase